MRSLGIYVAVPFCQTKCTYCNFHTGVVAEGRFAPYVEAVCAEIRGHRELYAAVGIELEALGGSGGVQDEIPLQGLKPIGSTNLTPELKLRPSKELSTRKLEGTGESIGVDTVYFGGGTPSLLAADLLGKILEAIRTTFRTEFAEVTLEADPETVTTEKAAAWVAAGINRVSFGVQSFVDVELAAAGRMHRREDVYRAAPILRDAGIRNISFDLIAGLPHQTRESWLQSLEELEALSPEHVSVYLLEIDEGSRLGKELLDGGKRYSAEAVPTEDLMAEFYELAQERLRAAGYEHYEISNWAKPGFASKHNLKYWRREPYLGFGAGAHSFSGRQRWANVHDAAAYVESFRENVKSTQTGTSVPLFPMAEISAKQLRPRVEQLELVTAEKALEEELFLGLRQLVGVCVSRIEKEYQVSLRDKLERLSTAGLIERHGDWVRLSEGKLSVSNEVFVELLK